MSAESTDALGEELLQALEDAGSEQEHPPAKRRRAAAEPSARCRARAGPTLGSGAFAALPDDLVLQVLACASAADLTAAAQTSMSFRVAAADNCLWRPLYLARWGNELEESSKLQDLRGWKEKYMETDAQEVADVKQRVPSSMQQLYLQMSTAKRHLSLPRRRDLVPLSDVALRGRISRWRGARGLLDCPSPELGAEHKCCHQRGPFAALQGALFMCESCGWAHLCGENCAERFFDTRAEVLVCPVSGRCFDVIVDDRTYEEARDGQDEFGANDFSAAGHWGRAYADGYNCGSEEELRRHCGVSL